MDYVEAFKNLKTNNKFRRKSPHKAVLLLTIIELYETNVLYDNVIKFDDTLKSAFVKMWNKVLPNEATFISEAYMPFWFMQSEGFWHIVPLKGKEDILQILQDSHVKPSETKLMDCVNYAELDENLYFLMTLQSGRSSLKKVLLETYTTLPTIIIDKFSKSSDNFKDNSENAFSEYESIINSSTSGKTTVEYNKDIDLENRFYNLSEDIQYALNIEYFTFLKKNYSERDVFKSIFPTVFDLYDRITSNPIKYGEITHNISFVYENFLSDLKITLMSEDGTFELIDNINAAIECLHGTPHLSHEISKNDEIISVAISENKVEQEPQIDPKNSIDEEVVSMDFYVGRVGKYYSIFNHNGECLFTINGILKIFHGKVYRFNYKDICFTVKDIKLSNNGIWEKGTKKLVAYSDSNLYRILRKSTFIEQIEDFIENDTIQFNKIKVDGKWYGFDGDYLDEKSLESNNCELPGKISVVDSGYAPDNELKNIEKVFRSSYDYLWLLAIVDFMGEKQNSLSLSFDELACMMIANAWSLISNNKSLKEKVPALVECIEFLIEESKKHMEVKLNWSSSKKDVYDAIKDYPMSGVFEDIVDKMLENAPYNTLKLWIKSDDISDLVMGSTVYANDCLYALHPRKINPYIEINNKWKNVIYKDFEEIEDFLKNKFVNFFKAANI